MTQKIFKKKQGFTLIEVMVAVFVIAVTIVGLVMGFSYATALVQELREISVADRIAQEKMEELRGDASLLPNGFQTIPADPPYTITISPISVEPALTQITVTVRFNSHARKGVEISRSLVTYFAEGGITKNQ
ncbi:prepilin-type N-terminal cleavage/methylation domain-containing protein [Candidatus Aerophobetes bacterium]|nr:prepilin-type N-terminal cleavage/methylation domain-containing protein [Candidatus Aerophobetes bacterium]